MIVDASLIGHYTDAPLRWGIPTFNPQLEFAMPISRRAALWSLAGSLASLAAATADDWPQWRGPQRDGVWRERRILDRFEDGKIPILWRAKIGAGYSGPSVAGGLVFVTDRLTEPKQVERVHCFDQISGANLWTHTYDCPYENISYQAGPRASVIIDSGDAYALGTMGNLHCLDTNTGTITWARDLNRDFKIRMPGWGISASPLIWKDHLILQIGGSDGACVIGLDKRTGEEVWRALSDRPGYSAPIMIEQGGESLVLCWTGDSVAAIDPRRGEVRWRYPWAPRKMPIGVPTPVVSGDRVFFTSFYDGSLMLRIDPDRATYEKLWHRVGANEIETDALQSIISTPVFEGDYIYGVDSHGQLRCLKAENGDRVWEDQTATPKIRWGTIHFVKHEDRYFLFNERGELIIARLSPQGYDEIDRAKLIDPTTEQLRRREGVCWSHPAFADRQVLARNDEEIVCGDLSR